MRKKLSIITLVLIISLSLCILLLPSNKVLDSMGEYIKKEEGINVGFRDITVYIKYFYDDVDIENNGFLKQVTSADIASLNTYLDDFEIWAKYALEAEVNSFYDFTRVIIDEQDYLCICDKSNEDVDMEDYTIYFYDSQTKILYYFRQTV